MKMTLVPQLMGQRLLFVGQFAMFVGHFGIMVGHSTTLVGHFGNKAHRKAPAKLQPVLPFKTSSQYLRTL